MTPPARIPLAERLAQALRSSWSRESSSLWTLQNPARGQCGVTSLVVQDLLGGAILKTRVGDSWHFYNQVDGERMDLTAEQFQEAIVYSDLPSGREEAFSDTNPAQYAHLREAVRRVLSVEAAGE